VIGRRQKEKQEEMCIRSRQNTRASFGDTQCATSHLLQITL